MRNKVKLRQHNAITEARYRMSALEKNIVYLMMTEMKEGDYAQKDYFISFDALQKRVKQKINIEKLIQASQKLVTRVYTIEEDDGSILKASVVSAVENLPKEGKIKLRVGSLIFPYLISLKENYTEYDLDIALNLRSKYSKRLYEMLSQYKAEGQFSISVIDLKKRLGLKEKNKERYENWSTFEENILKKPQLEISSKSDISFTYIAKKEGKRYSLIDFYIKKNPVQLELNTY